MNFNIKKIKFDIFDKNKASKFPIILILGCYWLTTYQPIGKRIIIYLSNEDSFFENISALLLFASSLLTAKFFLSRKKKLIKIKKYFILFLLFFTLIWGLEEISYGERFFNFSLDYLAINNVQGESNLHNSSFFQPILTSAYFLFGIGTGFVCSLKKKNRDTFLPDKSLMYYFLIPGIFYLNAAIIFNFSIDIRGFGILSNPLKYQEINEFLLAIGTFLYSRQLFKKFK